MNARYDHLDLNNSGFIGGKQAAYAVGLSWTPTERTRLILNYARMQFEDAAISLARRPGPASAVVRGSGFPTSHHHGSRTPVGQ